MEKIKDLGEKALFQIYIQQQHLKEKAGVSERDVVPEVEEAKERLKLIDKHFEIFEDQLKDLVKVLPSMLQTSTALSSTIFQHSLKSNLNQHGYATDLFNFFKASSEHCHDIAFSGKEDRLFVMMKDIRETIDRLKKIQDERHEKRLYTAYLKSRFDDLSKDNKNQEELAKIKIEHEEQEIELAQISEKFVKYVTNLWNIRYKVIDEPMKELIAVIYKCLKATYPDLKQMTAKIPSEELNHDYIPPKINQTTELQ